MTKIGKYDVKPTAIGVSIYYNGCWAGTIDGVSAGDLDEGNSFHELFYGFSPCKDAIGDDAYMYPYGVTPEVADKEYITLG